ncbi:MAG: RHS repeat-associated core domain-containing protein [Saprospiraceae bacterium]|nr:RHS repeat-associated core domain-containing protein [Saprospiraceae bacterium]
MPHRNRTRLTFSDFNQDEVISWKLPNSGPAAQESEITSENHYYPFGLSQRGPWYASVAPENKYRYNGKEWNEEWRLNMYDYGARGYMPDLGRWGGVDALAEVIPSHTVYAYTFNNPIIFSDPTGMMGERGGPKRRSLFDRLEEEYGAKHGEEWIPGTDDKGNIILTAEKGDNHQTLMTFFGDKANASDFLPKWALNENVSFNEGDVIKLDESNIFSLTFYYYYKYNEEFKNKENYDCKELCRGCNSKCRIRQHFLTAS